MSLWLQRQTSLSNSALNLALAASFGAITAATIIYTAGAIHRRRATEELKASIPDLSRDHQATQLNEFGGASRPTISNKEDERSALIAARARKGDYDEELIL